MVVRRFALTHSSLNAPKLAPQQVADKASLWSQGRESAGCRFRKLLWQVEPIDAGGLICALIQCGSTHSFQQHVSIPHRGLFTIIDGIAKHLGLSQDLQWNRSDSTNVACYVLCCSEFFYFECPSRRHCVEIDNHFKIIALRLPASLYLQQNHLGWQFREFAVRKHQVESDDFRENCLNVSRFSRFTWPDQSSLLPTWLVWWVCAVRLYRVGQQHSVANLCEYDILHNNSVLKIVPVH